MATTSSSGTTTSFTKTPQAGDDSYIYDEDSLLLQPSIYSQTTNYLTLNVMSNDLGGAAKSLFSVSDGDGNPITSDFELLNKDATTNGISAWERTDGGNWIRLNNGKIDFALGSPSDVSGPSGLSINSLSATNTINDSFVYAIRLGNGTLSEANVSIHITGSNDAVTLADTANPTAVAEAGDASAQNLAAITGKFVATDLDVGDTLTVSHGAAVVKLDGADFTLPSGAEALIADAAFSAMLASNVSNGGAVDVNYSLDPTAANLDFLAAGQSLTITYSVTVDDGSGTNATQDVTFTITGTNDAPVVTSGSSASVNENTPASTVLYTATASDLDAGDSVTWSLDGADASLLSIDASGNVTLNAPANFEDKSSYSFNVVATDGSGVSGSQAVSLAINNLDEVAPTITSGASAGAIDENSGAAQVVYTASADDSADISAGVSFSLKAVDDFAAFSIDSSTGAVTLTGDPNYEAKASYSFTVLADDGVNAPTEQAVSLAINNLDEVAPTITSGASAGAIDENSGAAQVVYTASADDSADISAGVSFSLKAVDDFAAFSINSSTGEVTLTGDPNYEAKASYSFTVLADDGVNAPTEQAVSLAINNLDEVAPTITSGASAGAIDENSGAAQVVYTASADDSADISAGVSFSLKAVDDFAAFSIDSSTGAVTLTGDPNYEAKASYSFTVLADDGVNAPTEQAVSLAINDVVENIAPIATDDRWFISDGTTATLSAATALLGNDSDPNGDAFSITALSNNGSVWVTDASDGTTDNVIHLDTAQGLLAVNTLSGAITYTTDAKSGGDVTDTFHYRVTDNSSSPMTDDALVTVTVKDIASGNVADTVNLSAETYQVSYISSGNGGDSLTGGSGTDTFLGGAANDILMGGNGNDIIFGDSGDDIITGNGGNDTIDGGSGNDVFNYVSALDGNDIINGFDSNPSGGQDTINLDALFDSYGTMSGTRADHVSVVASGSNTEVRIDTDNNTGTYEMTITLTSVTSSTVTIGADVLLGS